MASPACPMKPHGFIGAEELGIALILGVQKGHLLVTSLGGLAIDFHDTQEARQRCHSLFCGLTFRAFR